MELFFLWLLFAFIGAALLSRYKRAGTGFILGLLLGPIGLLFVLVMRSNEIKKEEKKLHDERMVAILATKGNNRKPEDERECPYCAETILSKAKICKHCGKEVEPIPPYKDLLGPGSLSEINQNKNTSNNSTNERKKPNTFAWTILILGAILVIFLFYENDTFRSSNTPPKSVPAGNRVLSNSPKEVEMFNELKAAGYLLIEPQNNKAYIQSAVWNKMDIITNENFSRAVAIYCGNTKGTKLYWVEIHDKSTGKKLVKYSNTYGFKVY